MSFLKKMKIAGDADAKALGSCVQGPGSSVLQFQKKNRTNPQIHVAAKCVFTYISIVWIHTLLNRLPKERLLRKTIEMKLQR